MSIWTAYKKKLVSAAEAARLVKSGDWVDYHFALSSSVELDKALAERRDELSEVKIRGGMRLVPALAVESDPKQEHFIYHSWHLSGYERQLSDRGLAYYIPMIYRNMPLFYRKSLEVDVSFCAVSPMDENGYFNFSLTNSASAAICEKARKVVVEVNEKLPRISRGRENGLHIDQVDLVVEGPSPDLPLLVPAPFGEIEDRIASLIIERLQDGVTIQLGVGALPNAVGALIASSGLTDLGVHTEMLVDAYKDLALAGKITNRLKKIDRGLSVFSFGLGGNAFYDWVRANAEQLCSMPINYVNDPAIIAANENVATINNCLEIDLRGQVSSESAGHRQISGTGGQLDFVTGAYQAARGQSFICLTSTYMDKKEGRLKSRIRPDLPSGSVVTGPRSQVHLLVTEWGLADLAGRSVRERAERIINIAHPDFREELIEDAQKLGLWRRSNQIA
ncbi:MAG: butyryl-CoA:acetate CoA-transferase [Candidatus Adiutrix sp.]|jgi:butyryl-CoA:acetate CoA-transferase|nr:butyryl-CoA:acetate CoA-transferase [Candidatus Adiutrix sp.]